MGAFLYMSKSMVIGMAKYFTPQEIEILKANPNVKAVRENRLTLTYEFRLKLWHHYQNGDSLRTVFIQHGFDLQIIGTKYIRNREENFKRNGCPSGGTNKTFGINESQRASTQEEIRLLLESGLFIKSRKGIAFHPDFIDELYHQYPDMSIEDALVNKGIDPAIAGYQRIYQLKKLFSGEDHERVKIYDDATIEKLRSHPYIKRVSSKQIVFHHRFYNEAAWFDSFHIDRILSIFGIDYHLIPIQTRNRIRYQLNNRKSRQDEGIMTDDIDLLCRIEQNKQEAMMELIDAGFTKCRECIPYLSIQKRKALCKLIQRMPEDVERTYTKRAILHKIGISKTSYYAILQNEAYGMKEQRQDEQDAEDIESIKQVMAYKGYPKGSRQITMMMPRLCGKKFSRGKVIRLMRKGELACFVRKANTQKRASKEMLERNTKPNKLKRGFRLERPLKNILTDVSYLKHGVGQTVYLSCLKDASSGRILGAVVSKHNDAQLAEDTLVALKKHALDAGCLIHSDQGILYLSPHFQEQVEAMGLIQSMSRRGNCWDNASQESFFGHFKDECDYRSCASVEEVAQMVEKYIEYYNNERPQWTRNKMTPMEFESYLLDMDDEDFSSYKRREEQKYENMMAQAAVKAKKRAVDMGIEA